MAIRIPAAPHTAALPRVPVAGARPASPARFTASGSNGFVGTGSIPQQDSHPDTGPIFGAPIYNPITQPGGEYDLSQVDPIGTAPIYAPGPLGPSIPGLNPGDWVQPDNSGVDPGLDPGNPSGPGGPSGLPPGYTGDYNAALAELDNWLKHQRENAIVNYGDSGLASIAGFNLDPQIAALAQQNMTSGNAVLSRINREHDLARQAIINRLAGHGIVNSGELGYLEGQENQGFGNKQYDARKGVLDYLTNLYQSYLDRKHNLQAQLLAQYQGQ